MKTDTHHQEILLMATTTYSSREWCKTEFPESGNNLSQTEHLEEICWNGMLDQMLPEIVEKPSAGNKLFLWQIRNGNYYLQIDLCEFPLAIEKNFSIDPHSFLTVKIYN